MVAIQIFSYKIITLFPTYTYIYYFLHDDTPHIFCAIEFYGSNCEVDLFETIQI